MSLIVKSRAPLRISFVGGGTELPPFIEKYGGQIISATINLFARVEVQSGEFDGITSFIQKDKNSTFTYQTKDLLKIDAKEFPSPLQLATIQTVYEKYNLKIPSDLIISTATDVPEGSGLGTSSTLTVALVSAILQLNGLNLNNYEIAELAFEIERERLGFLGGLQDHFSASFGGFNRVDFNPGRTIVNSLEISQTKKQDLESAIILLYTGISRNSGLLIEDQIRLLENEDARAIELMLSIKSLIPKAEKAILEGDIFSLGKVLHETWMYKKSVTNKISNSQINSIYDHAIGSGAIGGKLTGAGGGGYLLLICRPEDKREIEVAIRQKNPLATFEDIQFYGKGVQVWN